MRIVIGRGASTVRLALHARQEALATVAWYAPVHSLNAYESD